ncbi:MAG: NAD-dependent epimerase/dehydratase family protein [Candidatus Riflebacteria bacterium]|nr:NAD-dependent epimerase/dehydratase family protein [Candidatus Riflebacteria bacterium]
MKSKQTKDSPELRLGRAAYERLRARASRSKPPRSRKEPQAGRRVVVVTGVGTYWGSRVVHQLEREADRLELLGMDERGPAGVLSQIEFVPLCLRDPSLVDLFRERHVDTVVHLDWCSRAQNREKMFERNVLGTRQLLSTCEAAGVRRLIVRSSCAVYGAHPDNPCFMSESTPARARSSQADLRNRIENEAVYREFLSSQSRRPMLTILRFAHVVGRTAPMSMNRYLARPKLAAVLGFDPLLQFIHEDDVTAAIVAATHRDVAGPINVAAQGVLPLSQVAALLAKPLEYHVLPLFPGVLKLVKNLPLFERPDLPESQLKFLCNGDTTKMRNALGFTPRLTAREAVLTLADRDSSDERDFHGEPNVFGQYISQCLAEVLEEEEVPTAKEAHDGEANRSD